MKLRDPLGKRKAALAGAQGGHLCLAKEAITKG